MVWNPIGDDWLDNVGEIAKLLEILCRATNERRENVGGEAVPFPYDFDSPSGYLEKTYPTATDFRGQDLQNTDEGITKICLMRIMDVVESMADRSSSITINATAYDNYSPDARDFDWLDGENGSIWSLGFPFDTMLGDVGTDEGIADPLVVWAAIASMEHIYDWRYWALVKGLLERMIYFRVGPKRTYSTNNKKGVGGVDMDPPYTDQNAWDQALAGEVESATGYWYWEMDLGAPKTCYIQNSLGAVTLQLTEYAGDITKVVYNRGYTRKSLTINVNVIAYDDAFQITSGTGDWQGATDITSGWTPTSFGTDTTKDVGITTTPPASTPLSIGPFPYTAWVAVDLDNFSVTETTNIWLYGDLSPELTDQA
jgi:hypothetical protein